MQQVSQQQPKIQERILCPAHKKPIVYLNTSTSQSINDRILKCITCVSQEVCNNFTIKGQTHPIIPLEDMEIEKNPYKLDSWFIKFNENQLIPLIDPNQGDFLSEFNEFLKTFRSQINDKIDLFSQEVKKRYEEVEQSRQKIISYAQKMSQYKEIKTLIQNTSDYEKLNQKLNEIIETIKSYQPYIDKEFQTATNNFNFYSSYLNLNNLKTIQTAVDEIFTNFQQVCSFEVLDVLGIENNRIKPIQQNPNFQNSVLIGYLIQRSSKQQIIESKNYSFYIDRSYCNFNKDYYQKQVLANLLFKDVK